MASSQARVYRPSPEELFRYWVHRSKVRKQHDIRSLVQRYMLSSQSCKYTGRFSDVPENADHQIHSDADNKTPARERQPVVARKGLMAARPKTGTIDYSAGNTDRMIEKKGRYRAVQYVRAQIRRHPRRHPEGDCNRRRRSLSYDIIPLGCVIRHNSGSPIRQTSPPAASQLGRPQSGCRSSAEYPRRAGWADCAK